MENLPLFIFLALISEVLGTVGGFGSSLFFVPMASYFLDFKSVLGITAVFHITSNLSKIYLFKNGFDKHLLIYIGLPAVVFVIAGAFLSQYINTSVLEISLAIFLIALSSILLIFNNITIKPSKTNSIIGGSISGFFAGLVGTGGAVRGLTLAAYNLKIEVFIATSALIDLLIDASRSVVYYYNGFIHREDLYLLPILLVVSIIGTFIGKKILEKVSDQKFKSFVLILVLLTGIISIAKLFLK